jgi:beta-lactamase class A
MNQQKIKKRRRARRYSLMKKMNRNLYGCLPYLISLLITSSLAILVISISSKNKDNQTPVVNHTDQIDSSPMPNRLEQNNIQNSPLPEISPYPLVVPSTPNLPNLSPSLLSYNIKNQPPFRDNQDLQSIVDQVVNLARNRHLPTNKLSVSLVNLNSKNCCSYASYNDQDLRYPASVVKLFWLTVFYQQLHEQGAIPTQINLEDQKILAKTIVKSDNESASILLDAITNTQSVLYPLPKEQLQEWIKQRNSVNDFYQVSGYPLLNISQKAFPISNEITEPVGPDLQIRQLKGKNAPPLRNALSTDSVARLLYDISQNQAVSPEYSQEIKKLLKRDLKPQAWKKEPFNPIAGFFGESLPVKTQFYAKMGWTFKNRNDAAIITSANKKANYILVVFGDDPKYYQDKQFFPLLSQNVYQAMSRK